MTRNITFTKLTKTNILNKVSQITIFSIYFGIDVEIIKDCIENNTLISSPLREDNHPSCGFKYNNKGQLKFRDFAGYFWGDCFDAVAYIMSAMYNKQYDVSKKDDFIEILRHISITFKDIFYGTATDNNHININNALNSIKKQKAIIEVIGRAWNNQDYKYWSRFKIKPEDLNINFVYPVDEYYINRKINPEKKYSYDEKDPCYAYYLGKDKEGIVSIKLYFPFRNKDHIRFITNANHLEGIYNINYNFYDIIIITKSTKDRIAISSYFRRNNVKNIGVINIPHETYKLRKYEYEWLYNKLNNNGIILSLMDNDDTGITHAKWLNETYNIHQIFIPTRYSAKDFAEFIEHNESCTNRLLTDLINYKTYINNGEIYKRSKLFRNTDQSSSLPF